jgi:hypothetical protein
VSGKPRFADEGGGQGGKLTLGRNHDRALAGFVFSYRVHSSSKSLRSEMPRRPASAFTVRAISGARLIPTICRMPSVWRFPVIRWPRWRKNDLVGSPLVRRRDVPDFADAAQACLYHELLGGGVGSAALVRFDAKPKPEQILLSAERIGKARPQLMALVGSLAGVIKRQPASVPNVTPKKTWPKAAGEVERQQGHRLVEALTEFNAAASLACDALVGPTFVRYLLEPARGVPARRIIGQGANLQVRLQLDTEPMISLASGRIAVDVQRQDRESVAFGDLRERVNAETRERGNSRVLAGIDLTGHIEFIDLAKDAAHLLVAGVPGSGKSEWLRAAAASLMVTNTPLMLRLVLIDPKKNAFGELKGSPYLWRPTSLIDTPEGQVIPILSESSLMK